MGGGYQGAPAKKLLELRGVCGLFPANREGEDIAVYSDASRETLVADVLLPCEPGSADDWVQRGVALILVPPVAV